MNITNRIRKLEGSRDSSDFCTCKRGKLETWKQNVFADGTETAPELFGESVPDACEVCAKPIEKNLLILAFTESTIPIPEEAKGSYEHSK